MPPAGCLHRRPVQVLGTWRLVLATQAQLRFTQLAVQTDSLGLELGDVRRRHSDPAVQLLGFRVVPAPSALHGLVQAAHDLSGRVVLLQESPELGQALCAEKHKALALFKRLQAVLLPAAELLQRLGCGAVEQEGFTKFNVRPQGIERLKLRLVLLPRMHHWLLNEGRLLWE